MTTWRKWELVENSFNCVGALPDPKVCQFNKSVTERMEIEGGWLVRTAIFTGKVGDGSCTVAITFVPDSKHEWFMPRQQ